MTQHFDLSSGPVFAHRLTAVFGDCDPAGLVYFPRFFHFFHTTMEMWFTEALNLPYSLLIGSWKIGFPAVHAEADYRLPSAMGDVLDIEMRVAAVGRSSLTLDFWVYGRDLQLRVTGRTVSVAVSLDPQSDDFRRSIAIPNTLLARLSDFCGQDFRKTS